MRTLEILALLLFSYSILRSGFDQIHPRLANVIVKVAGIGMIVLSVFLEGWRWQMFPAELGFAMLAFASAGGISERGFFRALGAVVLLFLLAASTFLVYRSPIQSLPEPESPVGVGAFEYSVSDAPATGSVPEAPIRR